MNVILTILTFTYLSTLCCTKCPYNNENSKVTVTQFNDTCVTVKYDKPSYKTYYDNEGFRQHGAMLYTAISGMLNFTDNTPKYCFEKKNAMFNFSINVNINTRKKKARVDFVTCRSGAVLTNNQKFCNPPPECADHMNHKYVNSAVESLYVTINMNDVNALNVSGDVRLLSYDSPSDPRLVYNITSNTSKALETDEFLDLCSKYGPCKGGRFLGSNDTLYVDGGHPSIVMKKDGRRNTIFVAARYDPRPFVTKAKDAPCPIPDMGRKVCTDRYGTQTVQKLWEKKLPFDEEWLFLHFYMEFSYKKDCRIRVTDKDTFEDYINYYGPCGRYADMKRGNWPIRKIGLYTRSMQAALNMRYTNIELFPIGFA